MKLLRNCCFCISLTNGGVIVGKLALVKALVGTLALGSSLLRFVEIDVGGKANGLLDNLRYLYSFFLGLFAISVITAGMLIYGAAKRRVHFVIPHLVTEGIHFLATLMFICIRSYTFIKKSASYIPAEYNDAQDELIGGFLTLVVLFYLWLCVFSLYNKLQGKNHLQQNRNIGPDLANKPYANIGEI